MSSDHSFHQELGNSVSGLVLSGINLWPLCQINHKNNGISVALGRHRQLQDINTYMIKRFTHWDR